MSYLRSESVITLDADRTADGLKAGTNAVVDGVKDGFNAIKDAVMAAHKLGREAFKDHLSDLAGPARRVAGFLGAAQSSVLTSSQWVTP